MPEVIDPRNLLIKITSILERLKTPYMVTGGMAVFVWGRARFTADLDIVVELKPKDIGQLSRALISLSEAGYIDQDAMQEALDNQGEFNFLDGETGMKVDFWVLRKDSFGLSSLKRRTVKEVLGKKVYFISPEDLVLSKLRWFQEGGSSRHLEDAESVLRNCGKRLDKKYLKQWARRLQVLDALAGLSSF